MLKRRILVIQKSLLVKFVGTHLFYWVQKGASFIGEIVIVEKVMKCCFNLFPQNCVWIYDYVDDSKD